VERPVTRVQEWTVLCSVDDVDDGDVLRVVVDAFPPIAVFNIDGTFYATADRCTHAEASLADGTVDGHIIECPFHGGCFDIVTGQATARPAKKPLETYDVLAEDGVVMARRRPPADPERAR
jgi:nitrite reductase/ring-hydroxylating ferredoxin subunit